MTTFPDHCPAPNDWRWRYWFLVPIYPYNQRRTLRKEVVPETIWTFEQVQGIFYVVVPIRMTVVRLNGGGLLVYAPIAPTGECLRMVRELEHRYGVVQYIVLPTVSGLEHKVFVGPFARQFPQAQVFVAPGQWSFPVNLPLSWLGFPSRRTQVLPADSREAPFAEEFDYAILDIRLGLGNFGEVALLHRRSHTLLVADSVTAVPEDPPDIVQIDPYPLLFHARDNPVEQVEDTPANRRKGWHRIALFAFYFRPKLLETLDLREAWAAARNAGDRSRKAYFGLYPFHWRTHWERSFEALRGGGRLFVAPILQTLILNRAPQTVIDWANQVSSWDFQRIIPCHLQSPIEADPREFRKAFGFLEQVQTPGSDFLPEEDFELLRELEVGLSKWRIVPPQGEKV
jgi:hypothetical protein